ncbi:MAG: methyltransferase domain-containing protein [Spirochaetales bacterium]|nr:methyltransferase domain-containing protein [Spirochaetales bacterium]
MTTEFARLLERIFWTEGTSRAMPFRENIFDAVFSNGSLHEWENPVQEHCLCRAIIFM